MDYTEEKKMVMDCLSQFNDKNENVAETLFNVYPAEMNALVRLVKNCRIANVSNSDCKHRFHHVEEMAVVVCTDCKEILGRQSDC